MTGAGLMDFLIAVLGLCIIVGLIFLALEKIAPDEWFKKLGRYAIGGAALLAFLFAVKAVIFGGGAMMTSSPMAILECAIGIVVLVIVVMIIYMAIDKFAPAEFAPTIKYVVGGIALIAIFILAEKTLFGGGLGVIPNFASSPRLAR
jgi:ACR3 family arsenite efflux pump ArsB